MKFKLVESIDDRLVEAPKSREWTDEEISDIEKRLKQGEPFYKIALDYSVSTPTIVRLASKYGMQHRTINNKYYLYLNGINPTTRIIVPERMTTLNNGIKLDLLPSVKLGYYTLSEINAIRLALYRKISINDKHSFSLNGVEILAFYIKVLQEKSIDKLIQQLQEVANQNIKHPSGDYESLKKSTILSIEKLEIPKQHLIDFQECKSNVEEWLTELGSKIKEWKEEAKTPAARFIKEEALKYYTFNNSYHNDENMYSFTEIVHSLFDSDGIKIPTNEYKNMMENNIPYEVIYNISSLDELVTCLKGYGSRRDILYGYIDTHGRIVYIGITQNPYARARLYSESNKENRAIAKALTYGLIDKLIIFKSYLPTTYSASSSKLLRHLEIEFAENIFKTYSPENKEKSFEKLITDGTLNIDAPGKNQSRHIVRSIQEYVSNLANQEPLLTLDEYREKIKSKFGDDTCKRIDNSKYDYSNLYLSEYISKHEKTWKYDFLQKDISTKNKYKWLYPQIQSLDELYELLEKAKISAQKKAKIIDQWKAFHAKNNQDNTAELDDNIDGDEL